MAPSIFFVAAVLILLHGRAVAVAVVIVRGRTVILATFVAVRLRMVWAEGIIFNVMYVEIGVYRVTYAVCERESISIEL